MNVIIETIEKIVYMGSQLIASIIELVGVSIIVYTFIKGLFQFVSVDKGNFHVMIKDAIINHGLSVALEFLLTAEVLKTVYTTTIEGLIKVIVLVVVRIFIGFVLQIENKHKDNKEQ